MARACPFLQSAGVAAHPLVPMVFQYPQGHPAGGAARTRVVEDYLIFGVENLERFLHRTDAYRIGDMRGAIFPLAQGHDDLEAVSPLELCLQLLCIYEIRIVHPAISFL